MTTPISGARAPSSLEYPRPLPQRNTSQALLETLLPKTPVATNNNPNPFDDLLCDVTQPCETLCSATGAGFPANLRSRVSNVASHQFSPEISPLRMIRSRRQERSLTTSTAEASSSRNLERSATRSSSNYTAKYTAEELFEKKVYSALAPELYQQLDLEKIREQFFHEETLDRVGIFTAEKREFYTNILYPFQDEKKFIQQLPELLAAEQGRRNKIERQFSRGFLQITAEKIST